MDNRYNRHNRRKYSLKAYIVLVTKYRKQLLKQHIAEDVKEQIKMYLSFDIVHSTRGKEMDDDYDYCYECGGYGDDYSIDVNGELVCNCDNYLSNPYRDIDY